MLESFLVPVWLSLKTATAAIAITFALGVGIAWRMHQYQGKGKSIIDALLTSPLVLPPTVVGFLLLLGLGKNSWLGKILDSWGIQIIFTWYGAVLAATIVSFPLMYRSALTAFSQINSHVIECAQTLGASNRTIFWQIVFPLAKPGLITGTLLSLARALGEFGATLMVAGSIPGKTQTIPIAIYLAAESGNMTQATGLVLLLLAICLGLIWGLNYRFPAHKLAKSAKKLKGHSQNVVPASQENYLEVNIQKQLPNLLLDLAFNLDLNQSPLGIMGMSGAGKTTLLRCLAGLETPDRGTIRLNSKILFDSQQQINLSPQERGLSMVFQNYALFPHLSVAENIVFGLPQQFSSQAIARQLSQQLQHLQLDPLKARFPGTLSGGEQQRVALARALVNQPQLTLLDEPLSALDSNLKDTLLRLLQARLTQLPSLSIYVTHNLSEVTQLCPQILILEQGQAIAWGATSKIYHRPPNLATAQLIGCQNLVRAYPQSSNMLYAPDWQCNLQVSQALPHDLTYIGIHQHQVNLSANPAAPNTYPAWLANFQPIAHRVLAYLKLHHPPRNLQDYQLVAELTWQQWQQLEQSPAPWYAQLPPQYLIPFTC